MKLPFVFGRKQRLTTMEEVLSVTEVYGQNKKQVSAENVA